MARVLSEEEKRQLYKRMESAGVAGSGYESDPSVVSETVKTAMDVAKTIPQEYSMETLDDIIETASPELAQSYRESVQQAREESPFVTFMSSFFTPNPFSKLRAVGKIGSIAPEVASSVATQYGTEGEVDPLTTVAETVVGKGAEKALGKVFVGDRIKRRAEDLGATRASSLKRYEGKAASGKFKEDILREDVKMLEDAGLFQGGIVEYDANKFKFVPKGKKPISAKAKEKFLPPSPKEISKRLGNAKKSIGTRIDSIVKSKGKTKYNEDQINSMLDDMQSGELAELNVINDTAVDSVMKDVRKRLERAKSGRGEWNTVSLNEVKKQLYDIVGDKRYEKLMADNPDKMKAYAAAAQYLAGTVDADVDSEDLRKLNQLYGSVSTMRKNVMGKVDKEFVEPGVSSSMAIGSPLYRMARTAEEFKEDLMGISAQAFEGLEKSPRAQEYMRGVGAGMVPRFMSEEDMIEQGRKPQSVNLPMQLVKTKLPRTVEGILANKQVLLAKVAQQMPQAFEQVRFVVEERPEDIEQMMPMILQLVPHAFESDPYNRVNNKILDPMMQEKARQDVFEDTRLSNTQKANILDKLNRTNILEDY